MEELSLQSGVEFVGPFDRYEVVVNGWQVPLLQAQPAPGGRVTIRLDDRFGLDLSIQEAERVLPFVAHSIAVTLGFACHPDGQMDEPKRLPTLGPRRVKPLDLQRDIPN